MSAADLSEPAVKLRAGRNEWLLVLFTATTNLADAITKVALPLLAHHVTHSPGLIAVVGVRVLIGRHPGRVGLGAPGAQETPGVPAVSVRVPVGVSVLG